MDKAFSTDALTDSIYSLRMADQCLSQVSEESLNWKWAIIALHNSLQGFMALAIRGSDAVAAIKDRTNNQKHIRNYLSRNSSKAPHLLDFMDLYERIKNPRYMCRLYGSKEFQASEIHDEEVAFLNFTRNELTHYFPNVFMVIEVAAWLPMMRISVEIIEFLSFESRNVLFPDDEENRLKIKLILGKIRDQIDRIHEDLNETT